jgi:hypothetical protein
LLGDLPHLADKKAWLVMLITESEV